MTLMTTGQRSALRAIEHTRRARDWGVKAMILKTRPGVHTSTLASLVKNGWAKSEKHDGYAFLRITQLGEAALRYAELEGCKMG